MESPEAVSPLLSERGDRYHGPGAAERPSDSAALRVLVDRVRGEEVEAAREVRRLTRASARHSRKLAAAVEPLVAMLRSGAPNDAGEAALLNLAVRDDSVTLSCFLTGGGVHVQQQQQRFDYPAERAPMDAHQKVPQQILGGSEAQPWQQPSECSSPRREDPNQVTARVVWQ